MSDDVEKGDNRVFKLKQGDTLPWTFRDWKKRREVYTSCYKQVIFYILINTFIESQPWKEFVWCSN